MTIVSKEGFKKGQWFSYPHTLWGILVVEDDKDGKLYGFNTQGDKEPLELTKRMGLTGVLRELSPEGNEDKEGNDKRVEDRVLSQTIYHKMLSNRGIMTTFKENDLVGYLGNIYYILRDIEVVTFDEEFRGEQFVYISDGLDVYGVKNKELLLSNTVGYARIVYDKLRTEEGKLEGLQLLRDETVKNNVFSIELREEVKERDTLEDYVKGYIKQSTTTGRYDDLEGLYLSGGEDDNYSVEKHKYTLEDDGIYIYVNEGSEVNTPQWEGVRVSAEDLQYGIQGILDKEGGIEESKISLLECLERLARDEYFSTKVFKIK